MRRLYRTYEELKLTSIVNLYSSEKSLYRTYEELKLERDEQTA